MTVQELIEYLNTIEDKGMPITVGIDMIQRDFAVDYMTEDEYEPDGGFWQFTGNYKPQHPAKVGKKCLTILC